MGDDDYRASVMHARNFTDFISTLKNVNQIGKSKVHALPRIKNGTKLQCVERR